MLERVDLQGGNNLVLSTASPTPLATQAAGLMQSSIPVSQQPVPVFRPLDYICRIIHQTTCHTDTTSPRSIHLSRQCTRS